MKVLFLAAGLSALLALPVQAATPEENLYHWGECAVAGGLYQAAVNGGTSNAVITDSYERFEILMPRMEKHVDAIADALGDAKAEPVLAKLKADYTAVLDGWDKQGDPHDFFVRAFGPIMDRCLTEAATLPEA